MIQLFDPENKFWQFFSKLADVACLSFLWFLTSLPLVTLGWLPHPTPHSPIFERKN